MKKTKTEVTVVGGGPGGYTAAIRAAQLGKRVQLIEKDRLGGICLNVGCIPSKALISASSLVSKIEDAGKMGITASGVAVDMQKLQEWKAGIVRKLTSGVARLCKGNNVQVIQGAARFTGKHTLRVERADGTEEVEAEQIVLATGSQPIQIPGLPFSEKRVLSSTGALDLDKIPAQLIVVGGGYIGMEMGMLFAKLGSQVTVVEMMGQLLPGFEMELVRVLAVKARKLGIAVHLNAKVSSLETSTDGVRVKVESKSGEQVLEAEYVLVTVGRRPNSESLDLGEAGVELDGRGFVTIDETLRTSAEGIYAIGDLAGNPMLAHKAYMEGDIVAEVIAGQKAQVDYRVVPAVVFTDPEIATVGLNEEQARKEGRDPLIGKFPLAASGRALTVNETDGFIKVVIDRDSHALLGVSIIGSEASELIAEAALAIEMGAVAEDIGMTIHAHPTLAEGFMEAAKASIGEAVHLLRPKKRPVRDSRVR